MKYIQYSLANPRKQFIIKSKHLPEGIECSEHLTLEDDYFLTRVTVTKMLPYGDIQVDFKSRKDHPKRTIPEAIGILKTCEHNSIHDTTIIILSNTLHDWLDGLINTRALETVNLLAEAIIQEEEQKETKQKRKVLGLELGEDMKNIKHNVMSANRSFIVKHDHIKEDVELGEKIVLEDDYFIGRATITGIFLNGDIEVSMESRKEHPRNTITKAIKVIENQEKNSRNSTTINLFGITLHDWKDGRINTRAVELVATLAEEILENAEDNNENTDY